MLTRSSAEAAAAATAAAAVVVAAASVASAAARGLDCRRRAGRCTPEGNSVLHRSHRVVSRFRPLLLNPVSGTKSDPQGPHVIGREID